MNQQDRDILKLGEAGRAALAFIDRLIIDNEGDKGAREIDAEVAQFTIADLNREVEAGSQRLAEMKSDYDAACREIERLNETDAMSLATNAQLVETLATVRAELDAALKENKSPKGGPLYWEGHKEGLAAVGALLEKEGEASVEVKLTLVHDDDGNIQILDSVTAIAQTIDSLCAEVGKLEVELKDAKVRAGDFKYATGEDPAIGDVVTFTSNDPNGDERTVTSVRHLNVFGDGWFGRIRMCNLVRRGAVKKPRKGEAPTDVSLDDIRTVLVEEDDGTFGGIVHSCLVFSVGGDRAAPVINVVDTIRDLCGTIRQLSFELSTYRGSAGGVKPPTKKPRKMKEPTDLGPGPFVIMRNDAHGRRFWGRIGFGNLEWLAFADASPFDDAGAAEKAKPNKSKVVSLAEAKALVFADADAVRRTVALLDDLVPVAKDGDDGPDPVVTMGPVDNEPDCDGADDVPDDVTP